MSSRNILLNAVGPQDKYLSVDPKTTYFKEQTKTHTNFAKVEHIIYPSNLQSDNIPHTFGETVLFDIEKPSDLLLNIKLEIIIEGNHWENIDVCVPQTIYALIDYIEILSNSKVLQKLSGHWLYIWNQLYDPTNKQDIPIHAYASKNTFLKNVSLENNSKTFKQYRLMLNIPFWFSENPGNALPLWAIQNERIFIRLKLRDFCDIIHIDNGNQISKNDFIIRKINLITELVELDVDEKKSFQDSELEYLIEQVEIDGVIDIDICSKKKLKISLEQYPYTNEIIWFFTGACLDEHFSPCNYFNLWPCFNGINNGLTNRDHTNSSYISLNGNPINPKLKSSYYRKIQRFQYHSTGPDYNKELDAFVNYGDYNCIYNYSFALNPEKIKPSGFISTDKFNTIHLNIELIPMNYKRNLYIFQKRFNIIRIKNGFINILNL